MHDTYALVERRYGFWNFVLDVLLVSLTGGLWIIWILIREIRKSG